jgi:signal transduction histidine kinase
VKRRVVLLVLATTALAVLIVGATIVLAISLTTGEAWQVRAQSTARVAAAAVDAIEAQGGELDPERLASLSRDSAVLVATLPDGSRVATGPVPEGPVITGTATSGGVAVEAVIPASVAADRIRQQALVVLAAAVLAIGVAAVIGWVAARRMTRPLEDLQQVAESLARGDSRQMSRRYGVPEVDAVAEVLDRGTTAFIAVLEDERRVTAEASHQLRTPLTALSLRLEEILATDDLDVVHEEATAALGQVERLSGVVDEVASVRRGEQSRQQAEVSVDDLVAGQISEWRPAYDRTDRVLERRGSRGLWVRATPGTQSQVLATLLENSLHHGAGATVVRVRRAPGWVVIEVSDEGAGVPADIASRVFEPGVSGTESSGLGLSLARTLAAADNGRLELLNAHQAVFGLFLPEAAPPDQGQAEVAIVASSAAAGSSGNTQRR